MCETSVASEQEAISKNYATPSVAELDWTVRKAALFLLVLAPLGFASRGPFVA
jgi:hypothetical protein